MHAVIFPGSCPKAAWMTLVVAVRISAFVIFPESGTSGKNRSKKISRVSVPFRSISAIAS